MFLMSINESQLYQGLLINIKGDDTHKDNFRLTRIETLEMEVFIKGYGEVPYSGNLFIWTLIKSTFFHAHATKFLYICHTLNLALDTNLVAC